MTSDTIQTNLNDYGACSYKIRSYLDIKAPHFHVCCGMRAGGCFIQRNAWPVREMVMNHVVRIVEEEVD